MAFEGPTRTTYEMSGKHLMVSKKSGNIVGKPLYRRCDIAFLIMAYILADWQDPKRGLLSLKV